MSTEPAEELVAAAAEADGLAERVEAHLDAHPIPVEADVVDRIAARLEQRIRPAPARWPWLVAGLLLAATALIALRLGTGTPAEVESAAPTERAARAEVPDQARVVRVEQPSDLDFPGAGRALRVGPESTVLAAEAGHAAVVLVQRGTAEIDGVLVSEGHWGVAVRDADGLSSTVIFADGELPPDALGAADFAESGVEAQLEVLRWASLPDTTLETLDALLEAP